MQLLVYAQMHWRIHRFVEVTEKLTAMQKLLSVLIDATDKVS